MRSWAAAKPVVPANAAKPQPQKKWGPALLPAPTAPSEGSAGVRNLVDRALQPTYPLSILAHQLRRRFLSDRSLLRGARPTYLTTWPEGSLVARSVRPAIGPKSSVKTVRCSAALLGMTSSCVPLCSSSIRRSLQSRVARDESPLFRRLFPAGPGKNPKALPNCLPAEIGPLVTCRTFLSLPTLWRGRDRRPDHPCTMHLAAESGKQKMRD